MANEIPPGTLLALELQKLNPSAIVELFELDVRPAGDDSVLYFHNGTQGVTMPVTFMGIVYNPLPIEVKGFEFSTTGETPRPVMTISNLLGFLSALILSTEDLVGSKLTRRRTFARFLDGMPNAAPVYLPEDIYFVEQKTKEGRTSISFELKSSLDLDGIKYPLREITSSYCPAPYRGLGCKFGETMVVTDDKNQFFAGGKLYHSKGWQDADTYPKDHSVTRVFNNFSCVFVALQDVPVNKDPALPANSAYWKQVQRFRGEYSPTITNYVLNDVVYRIIDDQSVYFISIWTGVVPMGQFPPNAFFWRTDTCVKYLSACKYRFDPLSLNLAIPFNGFPGTINMPESS